VYAILSGILAYETSVYLKTIITCVITYELFIIYNY